MTTEKDAARRVQTAILELNNALIAAADLKLHVEIESVDVRSMERFVPLRIFKATIERREIVS